MLMTPDLRTRVAIGLIVIYSFDLICHFLIRINLSLEMMWWIGLITIFGGIVYSYVQFKWVDSK